MKHLLKYFYPLKLSFKIKSYNLNLISIKSFNTTNKKEVPRRLEKPQSKLTHKDATGFDKFDKPIITEIPKEIYTVASTDYPQSVKENLHVRFDLKKKLDSLKRLNLIMYNELFNYYKSIKIHIKPFTITKKFYDRFYQE